MTIGLILRRARPGRRRHKCRDPATGQRPAATVADRDDRLVDAVEEMRTGMDVLGRDLSGALERAERESKRNRFLSDLGSSIEIEELLDRVLDAALEIPGFDAAMVALEESGGPPTIATRGMTPEEEAHPPSAGTLRHPARRIDHGQLPIRPPGRPRTPTSSEAGCFSPSSGARGTPSVPSRCSGEPRDSSRRRSGLPPSRRSQPPASRRSRTPGAIARRAGRPRRTRSRASSTSAISTRRCGARRSEPGDTRASSHF